MNLDFGTFVYQNPEYLPPAGLTSYSAARHLFSSIRKQNTQCEPTTVICRLALGERQS
jgi:hypothetical protein